MTGLTEQDKATLLQIIMMSRFTPDEWERSVKPIVVKLQVSEEQDGKI